MIKRNGWAAIAVIATLIASPAAQAQTLSETLSSAYNSSGLLDQNRALLRAADEGVAQSVAATLPVINWALTATRTETSGDFNSSTNAASARISGSLTLYDGGVNQLAVDAQKEIVLATRQSLRRVEQDVLLRAVQAYMNLRSAQEFYQLRDNNVRVIIQEFRAAQDRFEVGEVTRTDVALAEARLAAARSLLAAAQGDLAVSAEEYRAVTGRTAAAPRAVTPAPVSRSLNEAKAFAVRNHPSVLEAQHNVAAAELNIRRADAAIKPRITLDGFASVDQDANRTAQLGVNLGGPIYAGGLIPSTVRQLRANRDAARSGLLLTQQTIAQQVGNAYALVQVARASRQASDQQIAAARVAFEGVREEATLGSRTTLDVLNAEQELLDAEASRIAAQSDEVIASYSLLSAMGLLTADHLNLPVQQYDPNAYYDLVKDSPVALSAQGRALDRILESIGQE